MSCSPSTKPSTRRCATGTPCRSNRERSSAPPPSKRSDHGGRRDERAQRPERATAGRECGMQTTYATSDVPSQSRRHFWQDIVSKTYFPLDLVFPGGRDFHASLGAWSMGPLSVSRNV